MATPEGKVKDAIRVYLKKLGPDCWFYFPVQMGMGAHGIPDILGCYKGRFFSCEVKAPGKLTNVSEQQHQQMLGIERALGCTCVTDNLERFINYMNCVRAQAGDTL